VFHPFVDKFVVVCIEDILVYSKSKEDHIEHLCIVLNTLANHKLYAKRKKCDFWMEKVHFLRHVISKEGISIDPAKVATVVDWPRPTNITEVRSFLGISRIASPLSRLLWKDHKFEWTDECETSFQELK